VEDSISGRSIALLKTPGVVSDNRNWIVVVVGYLRVHDSYIFADHDEPHATLNHPIS